MDLKRRLSEDCPDDDRRDHPKRRKRSYFQDPVLIKGVRRMVLDDDFVSRSALVRAVEALTAIKQEVAGLVRVLRDTQSDARNGILGGRLVDHGEWVGSWIDRGDLSVDGHRGARLLVVGLFACTHLSVAIREVYKLYKERNETDISDALKGCVSVFKDVRRFRNLTRVPDFGDDMFLAQMQLAFDQ